MRSGRRVAGLLAVAALMITMSPGLASAQGGGAGQGRFDKPQDGFARPSTMLRDSTPERARLDPAPLDRAWDKLVGFTEPQDNGHPMYSGASVIAGHQGKIVQNRATGYGLRYAHSDGEELPEDQWIPAGTDTIYDMASISKLFTSIVVMQQVEKGVIDLDAPVSQYLPEFSQNGDDPAEDSPKDDVTVRMLLTHTSGFPSWLPLYSGAPDRDSRIQMALTAELDNAPGEVYLYSDLNLITLGEMVSRLTGKPLDDLVDEGITEPLAMIDTGYNPDPSLKPRIAATEEQTTPARGLVWGEVHDENAWSLGGVAGHAGVFSTTRDMSILAQSLLNGGTYDGNRILEKATVEALMTNENTEFPGDEHGLGFELNQRWYMGGLTSLRTAGHTGYTGTSMVIDFNSRSFVILLTNRVHPSRDWGSNNPSRVAAAQGLAEAMAVRPEKGPDAWFSGTADDTTATLSLPATVPEDGADLTFSQFVDTEESDELFLEVSTDDGKTWGDLPYTVDGTPVDGPYAVSGLRQWQPAEATLPAGDVQLRWRYVTDPSLSGRGVFLDDIVVRAGGEVIVNAEAHPDLVTADGWQLARR